MRSNASGGDAVATTSDQGRPEIPDPVLAPCASPGVRPHGSFPVGEHAYLQGRQRFDGTIRRP
jgi:hypothetical protein